MTDHRLQRRYTETMFLMHVECMLGCEASRLVLGVSATSHENKAVSDGQFRDLEVEAVDGEDPSSFFRGLVDRFSRWKLEFDQMTRFWGYVLKTTIKSY